MVKGEGSTVARGVTPDEVFDFVLDPAQYTKADTKMVWVTKLADTPDGMIAREDGRFLGRFPGSVITRYRWKRPYSIDVTLEHGVPRGLHAWFEIEAVEGGTVSTMSKSSTLVMAPSDGSMTSSRVRGLPARSTPRWPRSAGFSRRANGATA